MRKPERVPRARGLGPWLLSAALLMTAPQVAVADKMSHLPTGLNSLGHDPLTGEEHKRIEGTGEGMPSVLGPFPDTTDNLQFLGQLTNADMGLDRLVFTGASFLADIWGWESPATGDEYAIVGTTSGVVFARITDPTDPEFLGLIPTTNPNTLFNFWWDMKVFNDYVYWVSEVRGSGVGIFDLKQLDGLPPQPPGTEIVLNNQIYARYTGEGLLAAHNISINEDTGFAYLTGATKDSAADPGFVNEGMVILDLNGNPLIPVEVGQVLGRDTHDAQVVSIPAQDSGGKKGGKKGKNASREIAFVFNGLDLTVGIYDVTVKQVIDVSTDPSITLSETGYSGASFTHQGWLTEDRKFLIVGDEEDELFGISDPQDPDLPDTARTYIFNVEDLTDPQFVGFFDSPAASIDHNLFVKGDKVYQAHYTAGIRVLQIIDEDPMDGVIDLDELAHMDTEPRLPNENMNHNLNIFVGPWGVYPFFESGTIAASDGLNGLILMRLTE